MGAEVSLNHFFHLEERFEPAILIIPYMEFVTGPLTCVAALTILYTGLKATVRLVRGNKKSES